MTGLYEKKIQYLVSCYRWEKLIKEFWVIEYEYSLRLRESTLSGLKTTEEIFRRWNSQLTSNITGIKWYYKGVAIFKIKKK